MVEKGVILRYNMRNRNKHAKEIVKLRKKGISYRKIGKIFNLSHVAIIYICKTELSTDGGKK